MKLGKSIELSDVLSCGKFNFDRQNRFGYTGCPCMSCVSVHVLVVRACPMGVLHVLGVRVCLWAGEVVYNSALHRHACNHISARKNPNKLIFLR
jgi:hypothetical protein